MRVVLAFLADYAVAHPDGKIYAMGAGIDWLTFPSFPATQAQLALALKLDFSPEERRHEQTILIKALAEGGDPVLPMFGFGLNPIVPHTANAQRSPFPFVYTIRNLIFSAPGNYRFVVEVGNQEVARVGLVVDRGSPPPAVSEPVNTLEAALKSGFETFLRGDIAGAFAIFTNLAQRFPGSADVQNNLGFTLLAQGNPEAALSAFQRAAEGHYQHRELLDANVACCQFLLGDHQGAYDAFTHLVTASSRTASVLLFLLGRSEARVVVLASPADYIALMALNAARCAVSLGRSSDAQRFAEIAQTGLVSFVGPPGNAETFRVELEELMSDIKR